MGFAPTVKQQFERKSRQDEWIRVEGRHNVVIDSWHFAPPGKRKLVVFTVKNARGQKQTISFGLSVPRLRTFQFLRFVCAAMGWKFVANQHLWASIAHRGYFDDLIGKRVSVCVDRTRDGLYETRGD